MDFFLSGYLSQGQQKAGDDYTVKELFVFISHLRMLQMLQKWGGFGSCPHRLEHF